MSKMLRMLALALLLPSLAVAQSSKPLVVIRFNQPQVMYEQALYDAVSRAVAAKPQVMFDVVSYAPATGNPQMDAGWQQTAGHNTQVIVMSLQRMGVPQSRIRTLGQQQYGLGFDEVHVFVR